MNERLLQLRRLAGLEVVTGVPARRVVAVAVFTILTALSAHAAVPIPGTPVPVTLQTMVVVLAGALLGPTLGAASQIAYLMAGAMGAPVFSGGLAGFGHLFGPTGGYLLAFPVAAAVTGMIAGGRRSGLLRLALGLTAAHAVVLVGGAAQLAILTGDVERSIALGITPFLVGSVVKIVGALLISARLRDRTLGLL